MTMLGNFSSGRTKKLSNEIGNSDFIENESITADLRQRISEPVFQAAAPGGDLFEQNLFQTWLADGW